MTFREKIRKIKHRELLTPDVDLPTPKFRSRSAESELVKRTDLPWDDQDVGSDGMVDWIEAKRRPDASRV